LIFYKTGNCHHFELCGGRNKRTIR